jgi:PAS domain S-box-containing protein/putative nucleotidyltransferase with HDIG domain
MTEHPSILIVDDDEGIRRTLELILARKNYRVHTAADGKTACALAQQHEFNLALLDIRLPDMSGTDVLLQLKTQQPDLQALILTGNATLESAIQALANGAYHYFIKPVNPDELLVTLEGALEKQRLVSENRALLASVQAERDFAQQILNTLGQGVTVTNSEGVFEYVNPAYARLVGCAPNDLIGKHPRDVTAPEDHATLNQERAKRRRGETSTYETRLVHADGRHVPVMITAVPRWVNNHVVGAIAITTDLTERYQREREMQAVATMSAALRAAITRAEMLPIILDHTMQLMNANAAVLITRHAITEESVIECARGAWAKAVGRRTPPGKGLSAHIFRTGQPYVTDDIANDANFFWQDWDADEAVRAVASVPLIVKDYAIGTLGVGRAAPITPGEVRLLVAISDIAASALHRAELHEQTERRLQHLVALRTVDQTINASLDLSFTLDVLLDQVMMQLRVDAADVLLYDVTTQRLRYAAARGFHTKEIERLTLRLGEGYAGKVALERRTRTIRDLASYRETGRATILAGEGFVTYCGVPLIAKGQVTGVLEVFHRAPFIAESEWLDLLEMLASQAALAIDNARLFEQLQRANTQLVLSYDATIEGWSRALELRDEETEGHTQRVAELTERLARAIRIADAELVHLRRGALLHDIGKMAVPDAILRKNGALTEEEWAIMRRHPQFAYELLKPISYLQPALDIPYCHHEKWDGTGYPRGLRGEAIPLATRIFALADVWDALRSERPYRPAWSDAQAREYIREQSGKHFDPRLVERFLKLV